uniref:trypsin n=1 Tax=Lates calcarifer TaxID=8187 RepID=A0A4W6DI19_LATCA
APWIPRSKFLSYFSPSLQLSTQSSTPKSDEFLGPVKCFEKKLTRESCDLVFCPPWQRCINGRCTCKPPYLCPAEGMTPVCARDNKQLRSFCQAMAASCQSKKPFMSHFGTTCTADQPKFRSSIDQGTELVRLFVPGTGGGGEEVLVCQELWDMAAANVALVASSTGTVSYISLKSFDDQLPGKCVSVRCQGYENSLAECVIYDKCDLCAYLCVSDNECDFKCVNGKCVSLSQTCDGMCCKNCRNGAFRCSTGVCLRREAVGDGQIDCLDGEDESKEHTSTDNSDTQTLAYTSPKNETKVTRVHLESKLSCGVAQTTRTNHDVEEYQGRARHRRMLGGQPTTPTQIQWQVALEMNSQFQCGGAYIGGCWVVTAAHCIGPHPSAFKAKFSLWKRIRVQPSTDLVPVKDIHVHPEYNPITRENDIALVKLEKLPFSEECLMENPAVTPVCVPWTTQLFHPNHTCTISGWGQTSGSTMTVLNLFRKKSIRALPLCAGNLDGSVDACQGDNGGPLVCEDELGVSYLWGIVSWRQGCVPSRSPGIYTQVAHYFEWIRLHTGWPTVTRFNS